MRYLAIIMLTLTLAQGANDRYNTMLFSDSYTEVRKGISLGADIESRLRDSTPLYDAARKGNLKIVNLLIQRGADVNAVCHGETALLKVVALGDVKVARELIKKGAEVNVADEHLGNTPLHYAVRNNQQDMIALLLSRGADMYAQNFKGETPAGKILKDKSVPALSIENDHLVLKASSFNLSKGTVAISIENKTQEFIDVSYLALYMDGNLVTDGSANKKIPPQSSASVGSLSVPSDVYENAKIRKSGNTSVKYGFAVEYDLSGVRKNLYKSTEAKFKLW